MNKIYQELYPSKLFSLSDASKIIKDYQVCRNNINRLAKQKYIIRIKAGLYYVIPLDDTDFYPDPIHIGSKLRDDSVISANTALTVWKLLEPDQDTIYISAKHSSKLRIDKYTYRIVKNFNFGTDKVEYSTVYAKIDIKVTDIERTLIDCLRIRSMKAKELIDIFRTKKIDINFRKLSNYLEKYNMPILYNKVGLILDLCQPNLKIDLSDLEKLKKKLNKKIFYFKERGIKLIRPKYKYYKDWNIMLPEQLFDLAKTIKPNVGQ